MNLEGANSGCLGAEVPQRDQGRRPGRESGGRSTPEADDFSQLKGYLDVTSGILGGHAPPPLNPPVSLELNEARDYVILGCIGISWTICKQSAPRFSQIPTQTPHHSIFTGRMLFPTPN